MEMTAEIRLEIARREAAGEKLPIVQPFNDERLQGCPVPTDWVDLHRLHQWTGGAFTATHQDGAISFLLQSPGPSRPELPQRQVPVSPGDILVAVRPANFYVMAPAVWADAALRDSLIVQWTTEEQRALAPQPTLPLEPPTEPGA